jgi:hypothetical protein
MLKLKEYAILVVFLLFTLPVLIKLLVYTSDIANIGPEQSAQQAAEIIEDVAIPWWLGIINKMADWGGIGAILMVGFIFFLKWIGEIK